MCLLYTLGKLPSGAKSLEPAEAVDVKLPMSSLRKARLLPALDASSPPCVGKSTRPLSVELPLRVRNDDRSFEDPSLAAAAARTGDGDVARNRSESAASVSLGTCGVPESPVVGKGRLRDFGGVNLSSSRTLLG